MGTLLLNNSNKSFHMGTKADSSSSSSSSNSNSPNICHIDLGTCKRLKTRVATNSLHSSKIGSRWQSSKSRPPLLISSLTSKIIQVLQEEECVQSLRQQTYRRIDDGALVFHDF